MGALGELHRATWPETRETNLRLPGTRAGITKLQDSDQRFRPAHCTDEKTEPREEAGNRRGVRQSLKLLLYPWPAFQTRAGRASREGRGLQFSRSCTRSSDAYLAALLLHFPRRADVTSLQQMIVDEGKQLPPLPGLGHARDPASLFTCTPPRPPPASSLAP